MIDLVQLARDTLAATDGGVYQGPQPRERIVLLAQHVLDLREALTPFALFADPLPLDDETVTIHAPARLIRAARAALAEKEPK